MQSSKLVTTLSGLVKKSSVRAIAVNNTSVNVEETPVKSWKEIPGPRSLPFIGPMLEFLPGRQFSDFKAFPRVLYESYGPIVRLDAMFGAPALIFLYDPEACAHVLRSENWMPKRPGFASLEYYRKKYKYRKNKAKILENKPTGLITDHGENWKQFRSKVNPVMLQPKTIKLYSSVLEEVAEDMVNRMKNSRNEKNMLTRRFDTEMNLWALESIGVVALGGRLNCFDPNLPEDSKERRLIQLVHALFNVANDLDFKPSLWRYIPTTAFYKAMNLYAEQEELAKHFIRKAIKNLQHNKKSDSEKAVLEKLLEIDEEVAVIMACDMLFAGVDTAANTMSCTLYLLGMNPEKQDKLREELTTKPPEESKKYLKACIKESMRILPIVAGNMRETSKDYDIMGYRIPKGMFVIFSHQYMSNMETHYPRALDFLPERWLEKDSDLYHGNAHPFVYSPFGFGARMCVGRRIAELEIETFLAKVIKSFRVEWFGAPPNIEPTSINYFKEPHNFIFKDV